MKHGIYSVYDRGAKQYGPLFQAVNNTVAGRSYVHLMAKVAPYDRDSFVLTYLGEFDDQDGSIRLEGHHTVVDVTMPDFDAVRERRFSFEETEEAERV